MGREEKASEVKGRRENGEWKKEREKKERENGRKKERWRRSMRTSKQAIEEGEERSKLIEENAKYR